MWHGMWRGMCMACGMACGVADDAYTWSCGMQKDSSGMVPPKAEAPLDIIFLNND